MDGGLPPLAPAAFAWPYLKSARSSPAKSNTIALWYAAAAYGTSTVLGFMEAILSIRCSSEFPAPRAIT